MDNSAYLLRIGVSHPCPPTAETLRRLHYAHQIAVPFENLDTHLRRPIVLNVEHFYEKIVLHGQGGFRYELNGLFAALLETLGFEVRLLSARVINELEYFDSTSRFTIFPDA